MAKQSRLIAELKCKKCGHHWYPRVGWLPAACPKCKSYDWNSETKDA